MTAPSPGGTAERLDAEGRDLAGAVARAREGVASVVVGQGEAVDAALDCLLAGGHCLLEGVPGLGKTLLARTLARVLGLDTGRVQCTPDLLPADILGTAVLADGPSGGREIRFQRGPVFTNLLLVDEINRATPRTQAALLQAMQEGCVSSGDATHPLPDPFVVVATQNPIEMEGTYPLPEAELDRFLVKVRVPPPGREDLEEIVRRTTGAPSPLPGPALDAAALRGLREAVRRVHLPSPVLRWIADAVLATSPASPTAPPLVRRVVRWGSGPRGAQALALLARVSALRDGRWAADLEDARPHALRALRHRVVLSFEAEAEGIDADAVVAEALRTADGEPPVR